MHMAEYIPRYFRHVNIQRSENHLINHLSSTSFDISTLEGTQNAVDSNFKQKSFLTQQIIT